MKVEWKYVKKFPTKYLLFNQVQLIAAITDLCRKSIFTLSDL